MSKLSKFLGSPKEVEIKGEKLKLYPLKVEDLNIMANPNMSNEEKMKLSKTIIKKSLKDEEITDEELADMDMKIFIQLMEEINKLNGFEDEQFRKIKDKIIQARSK